MIRDYTLTSPSLEGLFYSTSLEYGGLKRPVLVNRIFDKPADCRRIDPKDDNNRKIIEQYFQDLYSILMKKLARYVIENVQSSEDEVKIQALLQEMMKVKKLLTEH